MNNVYIGVMLLSVLVGVILLGAGTVLVSNLLLTWGLALVGISLVMAILMGLFLAFILILDGMNL